ncbi:GNAT family N-acetyltransferase [Halalkalibacillus sediminis]|uniref:GNAT family N-acetyltransferase n=1 Tax=Halalkalibacillus sediminis TaxID=2018042 RepID=A0A2I0QYE6_9BACI|nr:GNAT family N-acetyltransferase [Halalkalibacillus sediminis]PKR79355.1 GNAT family N-acetyltransferase [Halalkalibacillus sediminis]
MNIKQVESRQQLEDAYNIRKIVFVEEQNVPMEEEMDEHDETSIHFVGYDPEGKPVAASRLRFVDEYGKLERICVLKDVRGNHYGQQIIGEMEKRILIEGYQKAKLNGQTHAEDFYKNLGYETVSGEFMDAGIPHVTMIKKL